MLHTMTGFFPEYPITVLVRTAAQASSLHAEYPGLTTVIGTLDMRDLLMAETSKADIVVHASNADHEGTLSLFDGLKSKDSKDKGLFIHVSGAASLIDLHNLHPGAVGKIYSDVHDAEEIYDLPKNRVHVTIERRLMEEGDAAGVKVVILAPAMIFPSGTGIGKQDSYGNIFARAIMRIGYPFVIGEGLNSVCWISTDDLAEVVCFIIKEALKGPHSRLGYGKNGFYFCEASEIEIMEQSRATARVLKKLGAIQTSDLVSITPQQSLELNNLAILLWGSGMRTRADKLRALGWKPKTEDWVPFVTEMAKVEFEARKASRHRRASETMV